MARQICHARINGGRPCRRPASGLTVYCLWHNASLSWRMMALAQKKKHDKNPGWAAYDPDLVDWTVAPKVGSPESFAGTLAAPLTVLYLALLGKTPFATPPLHQLDIALWWGALAAIQTMVLGNTSTIFPKLLLGLAVTKVGLNGALLILRTVSLPFLLPGLIGSLGLLALALPPPRGPLMSPRADPLRPEHYPPVNVGHAACKMGGMLFVVVGAVWFVANLFD